MTEEKTHDAGKQENQLQDKFADELLSEATLENVTGGDGGSYGHCRLQIKSDVYAKADTYGH